MGSQDMDRHAAMAVSRSSIPEQRVNDRSADRVGSGPRFPNGCVLRASIAAFAGNEDESRNATRVKEMKS